MAQRPPEIPQEKPAASRRRSPHFAIWTVAATLSAVYLCAVSIRPAFLDGILPPSASQSADKTAADIVNIRDSIGQLQTDVTKAQSDITTHTDVARGIEARVAVLEQKIAPPDAAASALPSAASPAEPARAEGKQTNGPRVINSELETGSVHGPNEAAQQPAPAKPAPEKAAAAAPAKPKKPVGIRLATGGSVDTLRSSWSDLSARHSQELSALQPRYYNNVTGDGINYELVAGPFKTTADAKKVCQTLKAQAIDCQVSNFSGNPL